MNVLRVVGSPSRRWQWLLVLTVLLLASAALLFLLLPGGLRGRMAPRGGGVDAAPAVLPASGTGAGEAEPAAAAGPVDGAGEDLIPYGDRSLPRDRTIRGRVLDEKGEPVPDALVSASFRDTDARPFLFETVARARSEPDGFFVLGPLEKRSYAVLAAKGGAVGQAANQMPGAWVEVILLPGATVRGRVFVRADDTPVAGARVLLHDNMAYFLEARSDAEGRYELGPVPSTLNAWIGHAVMAVADGFLRAERSNLMIRPGEVEEVDLPLEPGGTLRGKVLDARTLEPVAGALVGEGWESWHRTVATGDDGAYALPNVEIAPNLVFTVRAEGYLPQQRQSDGTSEMEFRLASSLGVAGRVVGPSGSPVAGAKVILHRLSQADGSEPFGSLGVAPQTAAQTSTQTDQKGQFRFDEVVPGQVAVLAFSEAHAPGETGPLEIPVGGPGPDDVEVVLRQGLTVEGEVRDQVDEPLPSVQVRFQLQWGQIPGYQWIQPYAWGESPMRFSDAEGRFVLRGALPGKHWLTAWDPEFGWASVQIEGTEGEILRGVVLSFKGGVIAGMLLTADGSPVAGATIQARGPKGSQRQRWGWTQSDGLGRFRLGGLEPGLFDISAQTPYGSAPALENVAAGSEGIEIRLEASQVLRGVARSAVHGAPLTRFTLQIRPENTRGGGRSVRIGGGGGSFWQGEVRSPDGRFERAVAPGTYSVSARAPGHAPQGIDGVVVEAQVPPQEIDLVLEPGGGIAGTLTDADGRPVANAHVQCMPYREPGTPFDPLMQLMASWDRTDDEGRFFVEGLAPDTYLLQVNLGTRGSAQARVAVPGTDRVRQDLRMLPTGTLVLRAVDEEGNPVEGVTFQFMDETGNWLGWAGQTNANGVTTSQPMRSGPASVQAWHRRQEYVADRFDVTVLPGRAAEIEVVMRKRPAPPEQPR